MGLVDSLLGALERAGGDTLVMHVGERPYIVTAQGRIELASRALTVEAAEGLLGQLLPPSDCQALSDLGVVERALARGEHATFRMIAARGGDDIWIEIRRAKATTSTGAASPGAEAAAGAPARTGIGAPTPGKEVALSPEPRREVSASARESPGVEAALEPEQGEAGAAGAPVPSAPEATMPRAAEVRELGPVVPAAPDTLLAAAADEALAAVTEERQSAAAGPPLHTGEPSAEPAAWVPAAVLEPAEPVLEIVEDTLVTDEAVEALVAGVEVGEGGVSAARVEERAAELAEDELEPGAAEEPVVYELSTADLRGIDLAPSRWPEGSEPAIDEDAASSVSPVRTDAEVSAPAAPRATLADEARETSRRIVEPTPEPAPAVVSSREAEGGAPAVVVPITRNAVRAEPPPAPAPISVRSAASDLDRLLRLAAARAASALYIVAGMRPVIRVDGEINILTAEAVLDSATVQTMILDLAPEPSREALRSGALTEWICDVPEVGRVRCMSFRDHRGPGAIFRMIPARAISAEQLGLSREIQALCAQPDGLVLVTGPRSSGKSTLIAAFVDLINRTRADHVITLESQIKFVHESRRSFVSQREVRGSADEMLAAARAALREDPDVLVFEDLRTPETIAVALEAAESGRLVIGALPAASATAAIERVIDQFPADRRPQVQQTLAGALRGVVAQVLLRKIGGGRLAARELLLNTAPVANLIASGQTFQLPLAIESGRRHGMVPLNEALLGYVQGGAVDGREAYRWAYDKDGFLNLLRRSGLDTSFVERLA